MDLKSRKPEIQRRSFTSGLGIQRTNASTMPNPPAQSTMITATDIRHLRDFITMGTRATAQLYHLSMTLCIRILPLLVARIPEACIHRQPVSNIIGLIKINVTLTSQADRMGPSALMSQHEIMLRQELASMD
ncbi:hypothetical protein BGX34_009546 [Mortierella sp. NVP85]|nr:hypothetical protein BGX34_009546 [Mortierella sp. NVP85]